MSLFVPLRMFCRQADNLVWAYDVVAIDEGQFMSGALAAYNLTQPANLAAGTTAADASADSHSDHAKR